MSFKGKNIQTLIDEGILTSNEREMPSIYDPEWLEAYEALIRQTDAYANFMSRMTANELVGSEKQIKWAHNELKWFASKNASYYIDNRF